MRVEIRAGGDGVDCWNDAAIQAFADETNEREALLAARNPDLVVIPGRVKCYGCEAQEYHYGTKCTAELTKTLYAIGGQVQPRAADAVGLHREILGLETIKPDSETSNPAGPGGPSAGVDAARVVPANPHVRPGGVRRLFGRSS